MPEISIIIPVYNVENYIARCLDSVMNQSYTDYEILIVDDCGTDASMEIVRQYARRDSRIKILSHSKNLGTMRARETGYLHASGKYLIFIDGDDFLIDDALHIMHSGIKVYNSDIVCFSMSIHYGESIGDTGHLPAEGKFSPENAFKMLFSNKLAHSACGKIFRRHLFEDLPCALDNQTNGEDMLLTYSLVMRANVIELIDIPVYYYYSNLNSASHTGFNYKFFRQLVNAYNFCYNIFNNNAKLKALWLKRFVKSLDVMLVHNVPDICLAEFDQSLMFDAMRELRKSGLNGLFTYSMLKCRPLRKSVSKINSFLRRQ